MSAPRSRPALVGFWLSAALGWGLVCVGVAGILRDADATRPPDLVRWFAGLLLLHDLALVPMVLGMAWVIGRFAPQRLRSALLLGVAATALIVALAWPLVRGYGEREANPTLLPLPYGRNTVISVGLVWITIGAIAVATAVRRSRSTPRSGRDS